MFEKLDLILTVSLGIAAVFSPIVVAVVNNKYSSKRRDKELEHIERLKKMELDDSLSEKRLSLTLANKLEAFSELVDAYIAFINSDNDENLYLDLSRSATKAAMYCSSDATRNGVLNCLYARSNMDRSRLNEVGTLNSQLANFIHSLRLEISGDIKSLDK